MLEISENNPARLLKNHIPNLPTKHKPALPREELPEFYRRLILANNIERQNKIAIMLVMLVFVRNNELRGGQWQEVDFKNKRWIIPPKEWSTKDEAKARFMCASFWLGNRATSRVTRWQGIAGLCFQMNQRKPPYQREHTRKNH